MAHMEGDARRSAPMQRTAGRPENARRVKAADRSPDDRPADAVTIAEAEAMIAAAVAEAMRPGGERLAALRTELEIVKAVRAVPGPIVASPANGPDLDQVEYFERMADQVQDPVARRGYLAKAANARRQGSR